MCAASNQREKVHAALTEIDHENYCLGMCGDHARNCSLARTEPYDSGATIASF
jgi:hypothetical protein